MKNNDKQPSTGATWEQIMENGRALALEIRKGNYPPGTCEKDWKIIADVAIYTPYFPLYVTSLP